MLTSKKVWKDTGGQKPPLQTAALRKSSKAVKKRSRGRSLQKGKGTKECREKKLPLLALGASPRCGKACGGESHFVPSKGCGAKASFVSGQAEGKRDGNGTGALRKKQSESWKLTSKSF